MRLVTGILSLIILVFANPVELSSKKLRFIEDASTPLLEESERPSTSAAPNRSLRREGKPDPLPVITLKFYYIQLLLPTNRPWVYRLPGGSKYTVLTDLTGTKVAGILLNERAYHFVIPGKQPYQKVELKVIDNVAKETVNIDPNHDPLRGYKANDIKAYWHKYIRVAQTPDVDD